MKNLEIMGTKLQGHLKIYNVDTGELLLDKYNAIHLPNMATSIANSLNNSSAELTTFRMGDGTGTPDMTTSSAVLLNEVYSTPITGTFVITDTSTAAITSRQLQLTVTLAYGDANGTSGLTELGLFDATGAKITHITFSPITKDSTTSLQFVYDIGIAVS